MGGSSSKTEINALSQAISNIAMSTVQDCQTSVAQTQNLNVNNSGFTLWGSYHMQQQSEIRSDCFSDITKQANLQNQIIQAITQATSSNNVALLGAFGSSSANATSNLTNIIKNNITMSNIQRSYNALAQTQNATFTNSGVVVFQQADLTQGSQLFAAATLQEVDNAGVFNTISSYLDQQAKATQENPLDFIAKAIGAIGSSITSGSVFLILIIAVIIIGPIMIIKILSSDTSPAPVYVTEPNSQLSTQQLSTQQLSTQQLSTQQLSTQQL